MADSKISALGAAASTGPTDVTVIVQAGVTKKSTVGLGTATNDNATAGCIGEFVTSTIAVGSVVSLSTGSPSNVTSISLTAGDWDISAQIDFNIGAITSITQLVTAISLSTGALSTQAGGAGLGTDPVNIYNTAAMVPTANISLDAGPVRLSVSATTTVFLVASAAFTVSTCGAFGTIRARRMR